MVKLWILPTLVTYQILPKLNIWKNQWLVQKLWLQLNTLDPLWSLCQERRGVYLGIEYMEQTRALLKYDLPLNEIIYDFFDALKSRSKGYASFDYDMKGY